MQNHRKNLISPWEKSKNSGKGSLLFRVYMNRPTGPKMETNSREYKVQIEVMEQKGCEGMGETSTVSKWALKQLDLGSLKEGSYYLMEGIGYATPYINDTHIRDWKYENLTRIIYLNYWFSIKIRNIKIGFWQFIIFLTGAGGEGKSSS